MQLSSGSAWRPARTLVAVATTLTVFHGRVPAHAQQTACVGDCDGNEAVIVGEVIVMVNVALGTAEIADCMAGDANQDGAITVNEIVVAVDSMLTGCEFVPSPTPTATGASETPTPTPTEESTATPSPTSNGVLPVMDAVARDGDGNAVQLGQTITTEGVVTVAAGIFANNKLKVFIQDGGAGIMVYHQTSSAVDAFQPGQRLRATGVVRQQDPTSDANPATGTVAVDITQGSAVVLSDGNALPDPQMVTLATLNATGTTYTGTIVQVEGVHKVSGNWPAVGSRSTQVDISDDDGTSIAVLRMQRNTITPQLVGKLNAIGDGAFTLTGIVVQDDATNDGKLLSGFEIWVRGADDVSGQ